MTKRTIGDEADIDDDADFDAGASDERGEARAADIGELVPSPDEVAELIEDLAPQFGRPADLQNAKLVLSHLKMIGTRLECHWAL